MRKQIFSFFILLSFVVSISAQINEARQIDEFGILPCGDMLGRMEWIHQSSQKEPDSKIYVIYYSGRFRKETVWNKETRNNKILLKYPHRDDALNQAKAIPLYLTTAENISTAERNAFQDKIILVDGGFRQNFETEIWFVPRNAAPPQPNPTIDKKDIKFRADKPFGTPDYKRCYDEF